MDIKLFKKLEALYEARTTSLVDKRVRLVCDVPYMTFTMPKGSEGFVNDADGSIYEVKFDSNGKVLEVPPDCLEEIK